MPEQEKLRILFRMLITITREEEEKRLEEVLQSMHIPIFFQARGQGTAPSEILDLFGLGGTTRIITTAFVPKFLVQPLLASLHQHGSFAHKGGGIAITDKCEYPEVMLAWADMLYSEEGSRVAKCYRC